MVCWDRQCNGVGVFFFFFWCVCVGGGGSQQYKLSVVGGGVDFELIIGLGVANKICPPQPINNDRLLMQK